MMSHNADVAILILAHSNVGVFRHLTASLSHPNIAIFAHIDSKIDAAPFKAVAPNVSFLDERVCISWGGYSMIEAELALLRTSRAHGPFGSYAIISGDTLPIVASPALVTWLLKTPHTLRATVQTSSDGGYARFTRLYLPDLKIGSFRGKPYSERYLCADDFPILRRAMTVSDHPLRKSLNYYKGSQWFSISEDHLSAMLAYMNAHPEYEEIFRFTAMPDESFFTTLLRIFAPAAPKTENLVGVDWTRNPLPYICKSDSDLPAILASSAPFYRKFSDENTSLVQKVLLSRRAEVRVTRSPTSDAGPERAET